MLTTADITRVLRYYDLGTLDRVSRVRYGYVNETVVIQTSCGCYVLRRNHRRFSLEAICRRHELIAWLRVHGFPAPTLIPTCSGSTILTLDNRSYEIHAYVEGDDYDPDRPRQLTSIGATLARYHRVVQGFDMPASAPRYSPYTVLARVEQLLERDVMGDLRDSLAWYSMRATQLRRRLPDMLYSSLPHLVIHGDIHGDNLRFKNNQVVALFDYDQATRDARLVDVADALVGFATEPAKDFMWGTFAGPLCMERVIYLLMAYSAVEPFTTDEITALPMLVELLWLQGELGRVLSTPEGAPDYHLSVLDQGHLLSDWMGEHGVEIVTSLKTTQAQ